MSVALLSNNPLMASLHGFGKTRQPFGSGLQALRDSHASCATIPDRSFFLYEGTALSVLLAARDLIHAGWRLLHHPLYGNYRPYQQPYRSVLLASGPSTDFESLHYIEAALNVFNDSRILTPDMASPSFLKDCAMLDFELMRLPLQQAALPDYLDSTA